MKRHQGLFILPPQHCSRIYGDEGLAAIRGRVDAEGPFTPQEILAAPDRLRDVEMIFTGWGGPRIDDTFLKAAPRLDMVFYGAGSIKGIVSDAFWRRGCRITSAYGANAVPVVEFTLSEIVFSLKHGWQHVRLMRRNRGCNGRHEPPGAYGTTVALISLGVIGRGVCRRLADLDVTVLAYDPFIDPDEARKQGVELVSLDEAFRRSDVISLHTPWLPETEGLITGRHFELMKPGATFINTSRGAIVREAEMIDVLTRRDDIFAVLDVTHPEPPVAESPLYALDNVVLTPHIAGSMGRECLRMGRTMVEELDRYLAGQPLTWEINEAKAKILA